MPLTPTCGLSLICQLILHMNGVNLQQNSGIWVAWHGNAWVKFGRGERRNACGKPEDPPPDIRSGPNFASIPARFHWHRSTQELAWTAPGWCNRHGRCTWPSIGTCGPTSRSYSPTCNCKQPNNVPKPRINAQGVATNLTRWGHTPWRPNSGGPPPGVGVNTKNYRRYQLRAKRSPPTPLSQDLQGSVAPQAPARRAKVGLLPSPPRTHRAPRNIPGSHRYAPSTTTFNAIKSIQTPGAIV